MSDGDGRDFAVRVRDEDAQLIFEATHPASPFEDHRPEMICISQQLGKWRDQATRPADPNDKLKPAIGNVPDVSGAAALVRDCALSPAAERPSTKPAIGGFSSCGSRSLCRPVRVTFISRVAAIALPDGFDKVAVHAHNACSASAQGWKRTGRHRDYDGLPLPGGSWTCPADCRQPSALQLCWPAPYRNGSLVIQI